MKRLLQKSLIAAASAVILTAASGSAVLAAADDAGRDLRTTQEELRRRELENRTYQELERRAQEKPEEKDKQLKRDVPEVTFELKKVKHNPSRVLKEEELQAIF
ncbi:MAG: hypothetical protein IJU32_09320, partial [Pyramidobacter sp.]|nr:hypothetical protein [Pyramidobacter sp.]